MMKCSLHCAESGPQWFQSKFSQVGLVWISKAVSSVQQERAAQGEHIWIMAPKLSLKISKLWYLSN